MTEIEYLQTLIEVLFANTDITGIVLASLLVNLGDEQSSEFQEKVRQEVMEQKRKITQEEEDGRDASSGISPGAYACRQDTLLHYLTLEAVRMVSHGRKCLPCSGPSCDSSAPP